MAGESHSLNVEFGLVLNVENDQHVIRITRLEHSNDAVEFLLLYECNRSDSNYVNHGPVCALDRSSDASHVDCENDILQVFPVL